MDKIGNTGIEWSNPQVWGSVIPLVQQYAKDYTDRGDDIAKMKLQLHLQGEKEKQAAALEAEKARIKQMADVEKSMATFA